MTFLKNYCKSTGFSSGTNSLSVRTCSSVFVELIALLVRHPGDAQADQHGRSDQDQDATLERRNHAGTGPRRLRIAKGAILRVSKGWKSQRRNQSSRACGDSCNLVHTTAHFLTATRSIPPAPCAVNTLEKVGEAAPPSARFPSAPAQCANGRMCSRRMLSVQIMFNINRTKIVAGISESNKLRFSCARCMK
jgi:hypothetical protein